MFRVPVSHNSRLEDADRREISDNRGKNDDGAHGDSNTLGDNTRTILFSPMLKS